MTCRAARRAVSKRGEPLSRVPMLDELSKTMATAETPPPQKLLRLVSVGSANPMAINNKTAIRRSIKKRS